MSSETKTEFVPEEDEDSLSMVDVLAEEQQREADANAVLAGGDDQNCTYPKGYVSRQPLYACATCVSSIMEPAGICLACSLQCHDGHDLYELYTKRNFRCDCGNNKLPDTPCKLIPDKDTANLQNKYNQNFRGFYCICSKPYPDPEDNVEDEMIQCVCCEDWYHGRHLGCVPPANEGYQEMICKECMRHCEFLWPYTVQSLETKVLKNSETPNSSFVDVENFTPAKKVTSEQSEECLSGNANTNRKCSENEIPPVSTTEAKGIDANKCNNATDHPLKLEQESDTNDNKSGEGKQTNSEGTIREKLQVSDIVSQQPQEVSESSARTNKDVHDVKSSQKQNGHASDGCKLQELKKRDFDFLDCATFWPPAWRSKLCTCQECKDMYEEKNVSYLLDESDTVSAYEESGRQNTSTISQYDQGMQALASMHRIQQVEVLQEYNELRSELKDYLRKFAENGKVVREEDIKEFFGQLQSRKRQKTSSAMSYYCK